VSSTGIVAVGLLTWRDLEKLGPTFAHAWPVDQAPSFDALLAAIDEADRAVWRERDVLASETPDAPHLIVQKL
jgi:hypothetical protein